VHQESNNEVLDSICPVVNIYGLPAFTLTFFSALRIWYSAPSPPPPSQHSWKCSSKPGIEMSAPTGPGHISPGWAPQEGNSKIIYELVRGIGSLIEVSTPALKSPEVFFKLIMVLLLADMRNLQFFCQTKPTALGQAAFYGNRKI
jgi:hypothetical protein